MSDFKTIVLLYGRALAEPLDFVLANVLRKFTTKPVNKTDYST